MEKNWGDTPSATLTCFLESFKSGMQKNTVQHSQ